MHARIILYLSFLIYFILTYKTLNRIRITKSSNNLNENIANKNNARKVGHKISICKLRCWVSFSITKDTLEQGWNHPWTREAMALPKLFLFLIILYICMLILAILFYKITFCFPLTISLIPLWLMLYLTFLQTVLVANSYWFAYGHTTYMIFLLTNNHLSHQ